MQGYKKGQEVGFSIAGGILIPSLRIGQLAYESAIGGNVTKAAAEAMFLQSPIIATSAYNLIGNSNYESNNLAGVALDEAGMPILARSVDFAVDALTLSKPRSANDLYQVLNDRLSIAKDLYKLIKEVKKESKSKNERSITENSVNENVKNQKDNSSINQESSSSSDQSRSKQSSSSSSKKNTKTK